MLCFTLVSLSFSPLCNLVEKLFTSTGIVVCRYSQSNAVSHRLGTPCSGSVLEFVSPASDQPETGTAVFCLQVEQREKSQGKSKVEHKNEPEAACMCCTSTWDMAYVQHWVSG